MWLLLPEALTAVCGLALAALLVAERRRSQAGKYLSKPTASLAFILVALVGGTLAGDGAAYGRWIVAGLVLGAGGDVALMFTGKRAFMIGLVLFLLGHVAYIVACAQLTPPADWTSAYAALPVLAGLGALCYLWPHLGSMKGPVIAYVVTITLMVVAAIAVFRAAPTTASPFSADQSRLLLVGAVLFFASDLFVAREKFVEPGFANRGLGLPAYYAGQLLFAWSTIG